MRGVSGVLALVVSVTSLVVALGAGADARRARREVLRVDVAVHHPTALTPVASASVRLVPQTATAHPAHRPTPPRGTWPPVRRGGYPSTGTPMTKLPPPPPGPGPGASLSRRSAPARPPIQARPVSGDRA